LLLDIEAYHRGFFTTLWVGDPMFTFADQGVEPLQDKPFQKEREVMR